MNTVHVSRVLAEVRHCRAAERSLLQAEIRIWAENSPVQHHTDNTRSEVCVDTTSAKETGKEKMEDEARWVWVWRSGAALMQTIVLYCEP